MCVDEKKKKRLLILKKDVGHMMLASLHAWLVTQMDPELTSSFYLFGTNSKGYHKWWGFLSLLGWTN